MDAENPELAWLRSKLDEGIDPDALTSRRVTANDDIEKMRSILKEDTMPSLSDDVLEMLLNECDTFNEAIYRAAIMKSEDTTLSVSGLSTADTSAFFLRIARLYRPNNSGILRGG